MQEGIDVSVGTTRRSQGKHVAISGHTEPGYEAVAEAFADNFMSRSELGAACCMCVDGVQVVDLWGGIRNRKTGEPWERNTMVIVWSATKGMSGLAIALTESRGLLDYDERVCKYWPEFGQRGKEAITVRQLLSHQAGLFALDAPVDKTVIGDLDRLAVVLAQQKPEWAPGERQAYSMLSLGFYEGELLRRVDPLHRSLGQFFQDEIAFPLGLDFYIRLPEEIPNSRLAPIQDVNPLQLVLHLNRVPLRLVLTGINPGSPLRRSDRNPNSSVPWIPSTCMHATWRYRQAVESGLPARWLVHTACSQPVDVSSGYARTHCKRLWRPLCPRPGASSTSA